MPVANNIAYSITVVYRYSSQNAHGTDRPVLICYAFPLFVQALSSSLPLSGFPPSMHVNLLCGHLSMGRRACRTELNTNQKQKHKQHLPIRHAGRPADCMQLQQSVIPHMLTTRNFGSLFNYFFPSLLMGCPRLKNQNLWKAKKTLQQRNADHVFTNRTWPKPQQNHKHNIYIYIYIVLCLRCLRSRL